MNTSEIDNVEDTDTNPVLIELFRAVQRIIDGMPRTGIFHPGPTYSFDLRDADGAHLSTPLTKDAWRQLYLELHGSARGPAELPALDEVDARAERARARGAVPIAVAHLGYRTLRDAFVAHGAAAREGRPFSIPGDEELLGLVRDETAFFASAFLPHRYADFTRLPDVHWGRQVEFVLPGDLWVGNAGLVPSHVDIDFGDGTGFRSVTLDETVAVLYPEAGVRNVTLRARIGSQTLVTFFEISINDAVSIPTHTKWDNIVSATAFNGVVARGHAWIFLAKGHAHITNPVIVSEGFPGNHRLEDLWEMLDQANFASQALEAGRDLIVLGYDKASGTSYIEATAGVAIACIKRVITARGGEAGNGPASAAPPRKLTVGGASMGGLVTRYALALLEKSGDPARDEVDTYFSIDSPHEGGTVPLSGLAFADYFAQFVASANDFRTLLVSPAAQEMLLYWYNRRTKTFDQPSALRTTFLANLAAAGSFPSLARKFGLADGAGNGSGNPTPPGQRTLTWQNVVSSCTLASSPGIQRWKQPRWICKARWATNLQKYYDAPADMANIDSAPGGTRGFFEEISKEVLGDTLYYPGACFVPTASALAMGELVLYTNDDLFRDLRTDTPHSPLSGIEWSETNEPHVALPLEGAVWLAEVLGVSGVFVAWNEPRFYDAKAWIPAAALEPDGDRVVSVHEGASAHALHYRVGLVRGGSIVWDRASHQYDPGGNRPSVAINVAGAIVEVHKTSKDGDQTLYYYRGTVDPMQWNRVNFPARSQRLKDEAGNQVYGTQTRVAIRDNVVALVWEARGDLWYMLGQLAQDTEIVEWFAPQPLVTRKDGPFATLISPSIAITSDFEAVIAFGARTTSRENALLWRSGRIPHAGGRVTGPAVEWLTPDARVYESNGLFPSIAVDRLGRVVAVHVKPQGHHAVQYRIGSLTSLPASSVSVGFHGQWPIVALNDRGMVVAVFQYDGPFIDSGPATAVPGMIKASAPGRTSAAARSEVSLSLPGVESRVR